MILRDALVATVALGAILAAALVPPEPAEAAASAARRASVMGEMQDAVDSLVAMVEKRTDFERTKAYRAARTISMKSGPALLDLYFSGDTAEPRTTSPISKDRAEFEKRAGRLELNSRLLLRATQVADTGADIREALAGVVDGCKYCHDRFLKPK